MPEPDPRPDLDQARLLGRRRRVGRDSEAVERAPQKGDVSEWLRRRRQHEESGLRGKRLEPAEEVLLDPTSHRYVLRQPEAARQLGLRQPAGELQQCEWVAAGLGDNSIADTLVQRAREDGRQQRTGIVVVQAADRELRQAEQLLLVSWLTDREHDGDRLRQQPASDEGERLRGGAVEPLSIIDQAEQPLLLGDVGEQAEHREGDQKTIRRVPRAQAERGAKRIALGLGQMSKPVWHLRAELMQAGERQLHLGLDPRDLNDPKARCLPRHVAQQRCFADAGLPTDHEHCAPVPAGLV